jgi:hypothetical protein
MMLFEKEINNAKRAERVVARELARIQRRADRLQKEGKLDEARVAHGDAAALILARTLCDNETRRLARLQRPPALADVATYRDASICRFETLSDAARAWVKENVELEGWQTLGTDAFAVDLRLAPPLVEGMRAAGLVVVF